MTARVIPTAALVAIISIATACGHADTSNATVKTTSPAGTSAAPSASSAQHRDEALVRVVNASPAGANVDLFAGDLLLFDGLAFKSVTPYRAVDGERYAFALRPAGMARAKPIASNTEALKDGGYYTVFAMPGDGDRPHLRIVNDPLTQLANGKARLRVVHAGVGGDGGAIAIRAAGSTDPLFDDVAFQAVTDYRDVSPFNGIIQVAGGGKGVTLATINAHLEGGRFYTLAIVGTAGASSKLEAFLIEDALVP
jgi:hypothetical protein